MEALHYGWIGAHHEDLSRMGKFGVWIIGERGTRWDDVWDKLAGKVR